MYGTLKEKKSIRSAFGKALQDVGRENPNVVVLDADLACSTQTKLFADKFPERFFDCGIAEQDMIATAAGLAKEGKIPFAASFAMFATGRTYDQIRNGVCYSDLNVKIVGTHGGITVGEDGATHQALEDIALMREIPHMTVIVPADCKECEEVVKYAALHHGPMYIRISRCNVPNVFDDSYHFNLYKAPIVEDGDDVTVFTNGENLAECILASKELKKEGIGVRVVNVPVIKPIIATVAIFASVAQWNSFQDTLLLVTDPKLYTLQFTLYQYINQASSLKALVNNSTSAAAMAASLAHASTATSIRMTVSVIVVLPIICVYPFFQRYFTKGIMIGAVKG